MKDSEIISIHNPIKNTSSDDEENDKVDELGIYYSATLYPGKDFSAIPIMNCFDQLFWNGNIPIYWSGDSGPIILCLHGAGLSSSSFAPAAQLAKSIPVQIVSYDVRGHGQCPEFESDHEMSSINLISDGLSVLSFIRSRSPEASIVLLGHSMGGAIASKLAAEVQSSGGHLSGLIIVDIVEGRALSSLSHIESIINLKPKTFESVEKAIEWAYSSNTIRNLNSARVSIPLQTKSFNNSITWRTDLKRTRDFWRDWFTGMNNAFLAFQGPKQLFIADGDRIDQQMMLAQTQGKFKRSVFYNVGHMVQEDDPEKFVDEIRKFVTIFKIR